MTVVHTHPWNFCIALFTFWAFILQVFHIVFHSLLISTYLFRSCLYHSVYIFQFHLVSFPKSGMCLCVCTFCNYFYFYILFIFDYILLRLYSINAWCLVPNIIMFLHVSWLYMKMKSTFYFYICWIDFIKISFKNIWNP